MSWLELTDVNGDGLQDAVVLVEDGGTAIVRYKLYLGYGKWAPASGFTEVNLDDLDSSDLDHAQLEDLDGDGLSDVVVVSGTSVSWRNLNNGQCASRRDIVAADVNGDIPSRDGTQTVLFADMNGNGTEDGGGLHEVERYDYHAGYYDLSSPPTPPATPSWSATSSPSARSGPAPASASPSAAPCGSARTSPAPPSGSRTASPRRSSAPRGRWSPAPRPTTELRLVASAHRPRRSTWRVGILRAPR